MPRFILAGEAQRHKLSPIQGFYFFILIPPDGSLMSDSRLHLFYLLLNQVHKFFFILFGCMEVGLH